MSLFKLILIGAIPMSVNFSVVQMNVVAPTNMTEGAKPFHQLAILSTYKLFYIRVKEPTNVWLEWAKG